MKRVSITVIYLFIFLLSYSQLSFIGQTIQQVKTFWSKKVALKHIVTGKYDDEPKDQYLWVTVDTTLGAPVFSALFDKKGKCKEHETEFKGELLEQYINLLNNNKSLKRKGEIWESGKGYYYKVEASVQEQMYKLVCRRT